MPITTQKHKQKTFNPTRAATFFSQKKMTLESDDYFDIKQYLKLLPVPQFIEALAHLIYIDICSARSTLIDELLYDTPSHLLLSAKKRLLPLFSEQERLIYELLHVVNEPYLESITWINDHYRLLQFLTPRLHRFLVIGYSDTLSPAELSMNVISGRYIALCIDSFRQSNTQSNANYARALQQMIRLDNTAQQIHFNIGLSHLSEGTQIHLLVVMFRYSDLVSSWFEKFLLSQFNQSAYLKALQKLNAAEMARLMTQTPRLIIGALDRTTTHLIGLLHQIPDALLLQLYPRCKIERLEHQLGQLPPPKTINTLIDGIDHSPEAIQRMVLSLAASHDASYQRLSALFQRPEISPRRLREALVFEILQATSLEFIELGFYCINRYEFAYILNRHAPSLSATLLQHKLNEIQQHGGRLGILLLEEIALLYHYKRYTKLAEIYKALAELPNYNESTLVQNLTGNNPLSVSLNFEIPTTYLSFFSSIAIDQSNIERLRAYVDSYLNARESQALQKNLRECLPF